MWNEVHNLSKYLQDSGDIETYYGSVITPVQYAGDGREVFMLSPMQGIDKMQDVRSKDEFLNMILNV